MSQSPAQVAAHARASEAAQERQRHIEEDILWLHKNGVHPEWWPDRVGVPSLSAVEKRMRNYPEIRRAIASAITLAEACKK